MTKRAMRKLLTTTVAALVLAAPASYAHHEESRVSPWKDLYSFEQCAAVIAQESRLRNAGEATKLKYHYNDAHALVEKCIEKLKAIDSIRNTYQSYSHTCGRRLTYVASIEMYSPEALEDYDKLVESKGLTPRKEQKVLAEECMTMFIDLDIATWPEEPEYVQELRDKGVNNDNK